MKTVVVLGVLLGTLGVAVVYAVLAWGPIEAGFRISGHGMLAMALGTLGTLGLGIGLMFLVFYSHRHGYDDAADEWRRPGRGPGRRRPDPDEEGPP